jgi:hypothetical protein
MIDDAEKEARQLKNMQKIMDMTNKTSVVMRIVLP